MQIEKLQNDRRTEKFKVKYGKVYATELDALPIYIEDEFKEMVVDSVNQYFDEDIYQKELDAHADEHSEETIRQLVKDKVNKFNSELSKPKSNAD